MEYIYKEKCLRNKHAKTQQRTLHMWMNELKIKMNWKKKTHKHFKLTEHENGILSLIFAENETLTLLHRKKLKNKWICLARKIRRRKTTKQQ